VEWFRLVNASPDMKLTLLDADDVRAGVLARLDLLVMPGGSSALIKKDLGPAGVDGVKDFIRNGGGYIGTCAGCSLLLDEKEDAARGISVIPYGRAGSKGLYMMPVAVNARGAAAMGIPAGEYKVRYSAGPVLVASKRTIEGASFDVWGRYAGDFDCTRSDLRMNGHAAIVGGTYGKGRVFAIACHPESFPATHFILKGAFRYVTGRDVAFPPRSRAVRALSVGFFSPVIRGKEVAETALALDALPSVDLFPIAGEEIDTGMLDHIDYLVLPDGVSSRYSALKGKRELLDAYFSRGGKAVGWGAGAEHLPEGAVRCASGADTVKFLAGEAAKD
jgi:glutamine amidotransferase-like uncharacterized protein